MTLDLIGDMLPVAVAIAFSPFPLVAVIVVLSSAHARRSGPAFVLGWLIGLSAMTTFVVVVLQGADNPDDGMSSLGAWVRLVVGVALLALAVREWRHRPHDESEIEVPGWMDALSGATPGRVLLIGAALGGINPKNIALVLVASATIAELATTPSETTTAIITFVVLSSLTVILAVAAFVVDPRRTSAPLASIKHFMLANNAVIMMVLFVVFGFRLIGDALGHL